MLNYTWRTNDIVYLGGAPRGRPGGQYFPVPMWEKNGSRDAFRYFIHEATGGSDHIVFNNASVAVPGIEFFTWPDQWYHADTDTPDKGDPTEMKRVAFIGATTAWVSANLTDEMVPDLFQAVSDFGYNRVAERGIPKAMEALANANRMTVRPPGFWPWPSSKRPWSGSGMLSGRFTTSTREAVWLRASSIVNSHLGRFTEKRFGSSSLKQQLPGTQAGW